MKKLLFLFFSFTVSISCFSQARLTEIYPDGGGNNQFFELFNFGTSLNGLKLISKYKKYQGQTLKDSGFYVFTFPSTSGLTPSRYWYAAQSAQIGSGSNQISLSGAAVNYNTVKSIKRYSQVNGVVSPSVDTTVAMFSSGDNFVFLVNGSTIIDYMVSGPNANSIANVQNQINGWAPFVLGANTIRFSGIQLFKQYVPNNNAGSNGFYLVSTSGSCQTSGNSPWITGNSLTPGIRNTGSTIDPVADYWEQVYKIPTTPDRLTYGSTFEQVNNSFPTPTYALDNLGSSSSSPTKMYFQVSLSNTNINASEFSSQSKGLFSIFTDVDNSRTISASDIDVTTSNAQITYNGLSANVVLNLTPNMFTVSGTTKRLNPILFRILNDANGCFETRNIISTNIDFLLPVMLVNFNTSSQSNVNQLKWKTSSEQNNKGFEIQRSIGNTNDFKTIGFVGTRAKDGNSQTEIAYSFEDADVKAGQTHYYRLNQIDFDGKATLSPVRSVKPGSIESNLNVYPNPSQGSVTVNTGSASGKLNIYVLDNSGRVVNQYINVSTSNVRINNLKKGFYTLKLVNTETGEQSAQRVVVQ